MATRSLEYEHVATDDSSEIFPWPHTNISKLIQATQESDASTKRASTLNRLEVLGREILRFASIGDLRPAQRRYMGYINGEDITFLADKGQFVQAVTKMGYTAPKQILVQPNDNWQQLLTDSGFNPEENVYCKPTDSGDGVGIRVMPFGELPQFLKTIQREYAIQEEVAVGSPEYRYALLRDKNQNMWRIAFERTRFSVIGDGQKNLGQLIATNDSASRLARIITLMKNRHRLHEVPPKEEIVTLSKVVNLPQGGKETVPQDLKRIKNLDLFMLRFLQDLEDYLAQKGLSHSLQLVCFDIGIKDTSILDKEYDFEQMKENVVFFELQMPFDLGGYYRTISHSKLVRKLVPKLITRAC